MSFPTAEYRKETPVAGNQNRWEPTEQLVLGWDFGLIPSGILTLFHKIFGTHLNSTSYIVNKRPAMANWPVPFYNQGWESLLYWEEKSGILIAYIIANEHIMNMMRRVRNTLAFVLLSFCSGRSKKQYQQLTTRNRYEE